MTWRVIRTIVRGQFANDDCFLKWVGNNPAQIAIAKVIDLPAVSGAPNDPNDQRLYIVYQAAAVAMPNCPNGNPSLVTSGGTDGWDTQAQAQAVVDGDVNQRNAVAAQVAKQNAEAVSAGNIAAGVAKDVAKDVKAAAPSIFAGLGVLGFGAVVGGAVVLYIWVKGK